MHCPVLFDENVCDSCNICLDVCPMDIFGLNPSQGKPPLVLYGDECRYCGACWMRCPHRKKHALTIVVPPSMRASLERKETRKFPSRFVRVDYPDQDDANFFCFLSQKFMDGKIRFAKLPV